MAIRILRNIVCVLGALSALAAGAGLPGVQTGKFSPEYIGGAEYYYDDPDMADAMPFLFKHNEENMTCSDAPKDVPFQKQIRGVNIGGWLVLEPWITPSLFYQFLGAPERYKQNTPQHVGMDTYTFCAALGPEEGNKQLRRHWETWVTERDIRELYMTNIDSLRVPVGDWMWRPYGPYVGCTDGAIEHFERLLGLAAKYGMKVLIDLHALEGSQNGLDNSGLAAETVWRTKADLPSDSEETWQGGDAATGTTFSHWATRKGEWIGKYELDSKSYSAIYWHRLDETLDVVRAIAEKYSTNAAVMGLQPVNEPWQFTPIGPLQRFYWEGYKVVKRRAPGWKWFMHDSFRLHSGLWRHFMRGCPGIMLDTHIYQAWNRPAEPEAFYTNACAQKHTIAEYEESIMPVVVGEWSLATDNCAMWLNGFNDNLPGYPMVQCDLVPCPEPYMGREQPGAPPPRWFNQRGPFGTGTSTPAYGMCPIDKSWPEDDAVMTNLGHKKLNAWSYGHGWFFWNFKTELEPKWDYIRAVANGWLPRDAQANNEEVYNACQHENSGHVACVARQDADKQTILEAVTWACDNANPPIPQCDADANGRVLNASQIFTQSWHAARLVGGTCDFNGAAELADLDTIGLVIVKDNTTVAQRKPAPPPDVEEEMSAEQLARAVAPLDGDTPEAIAARTAMVAAKAVKTAAAAGGTSPPLLSMERLAAYGRGSHGRSPAALAAPLAAVALLALAVVGARAGARSWRARRAAAGDYAWAEEGGSDGGIRLGLVGRRDGERLLASGLVDNGA